MIETVFAATCPSSISGISPLSLSSIEQRRRGVFQLGHHVSGSRRGSGACPSLPPPCPFKSGPCLMPDVRVPSSFDPHLLLARHPPPPPRLYLPSSPNLSPRKSACGWFSPPSPLPHPRQSRYRPPPSPVCPRFATILFCFLNDLLHEYRRSCLQ